MTLPSFSASCFAEIISRQTLASLPSAIRLLRQWMPIRICQEAHAGEGKGWDFGDRRELVSGKEISPVLPACQTTLPLRQWWVSRGRDHSWLTGTAQLQIAFVLFETKTHIKTLRWTLASQSPYMFLIPVWSHWTNPPSELVTIMCLFNQSIEGGGWHLACRVASNNSSSELNCFALMDGILWTHK